MEEREKEEQQFVYWLIKKPKGVADEEIRAMRCPRKPRKTKRSVETSDGQLLEASFEEPAKPMLTLRPRTTYTHSGKRKFKSGAEISGVVHINRSMNPEGMTENLKDYYYEAEDPNDLK